jgi:gluconolactonase
MKSTRSSVGALLITVLALANAPAESPIAPGAKPERLASGFEFTEGPTCDAAGNVFFTDQPNDRILKWSVDGKLSTFLQPCGRANGMFFDRQGNLIACADEKNELWSITPDGKGTVLVKNYEGKLLTGRTMSGFDPTADCISPTRTTNVRIGNAAPKNKPSMFIFSRRTGRN